MGAAITVAVLMALAAGVVAYGWFRFDQLEKVRVADLVPRSGSRPFDVLLVGTGATTTGAPARRPARRAGALSGTSPDLVVARVVPTTRQVRLLAIPPTTLVEIPGDRAGVSGPHVLGSALGSGPSLLVEAIERDFHLPVTYYVEVDLQRLQGLVGSLGGVRLDFADPVRDPYSGLEVNRTGCQLLDGAQAAALYRSSHLYYFAGGRWGYGGTSGTSRLRRQATLLDAVATRLQGAALDPIAMYDFLAAAARDVTIDQTISAGRLISLAQTFRGFPPSELEAQILPTAPGVIGRSVVALPATGPDRRTISQFLAFGTGRSGGARPPLTPITTVPGSPAVSPGEVDYGTAAEPWNPAPCRT